MTNTMAEQEIVYTEDQIDDFRIAFEGQLTGLLSKAMIQSIKGDTIDILVNKALEESNLSITHENYLSSYKSLFDYCEAYIEQMWDTMADDGSADDFINFNEEHAQKFKNLFIKSI